MKIKVYTAIVGDHDPARHDITVHTDDILGNPLLSARFYKTCPHILYPNAEWTIWIDGNVFLNVDPEELVDRSKNNSYRTDYGVFAHFHRDNVAEEFDTVRDHNMSTTQELTRLLPLYRRSLASTPLAMTMVLVRRNTSDISARNAAWWQSICLSSRRDQLSFPLHFPGPSWPTVDFTEPNEYFTRGA